MINIISLHYFLWFGALTPIYGYISVYAEHYANASSSQYGLLNMVLPFATIVTKLFFCSLADRNQAHKTFFVWFLVAAFIGYGSFGVLPFFFPAKPKEFGLDITTWILICLMTSLATISMSVICCLSDAFAMNLSKKNSTSYGYIRVWGTIGWAIGSLVIAYINQIQSLPFLVPGLIMTGALLFIDIIFVTVWPKRNFELDKQANECGYSDIALILTTAQPAINEPTSRRISSANSDSVGNNGNNYGSTLSNHDQNEPIDQSGKTISDLRLQWLLFKGVANRRRSLFRYMILFTISGALMSLQWSYFFLFLNEIYTNDFSFISGLSMLGQSLLGELPFFVLSQVIINGIGRSHALSISILSIGVRYMLYEYLLPNSSMYFVLLTESFQGTNFGLFYVVMTEVGLDYSDCDDAIVAIILEGHVANNVEKIQQLRQALRATMQSLMSACYEGLGVGIGAIVGGVVIQYYGFSHLWIWASVISFVLGGLNFLIDILDIQIFIDKPASNNATNNPSSLVISSTNKTMPTT